MQYAERAGGCLINSKEGKGYMKFNDTVPIYVQIANDIKEKMINGQLKEGDKLPSVREYSSLYQVTPLTVQRAIMHMEAEGIIHTKKGVGSFIQEGSNQALQVSMVGQQVQEFVQRMKHMGIEDERIMQMVKEAIEDEKNHRS
jgi:DNA-binding transcriptional regulator YhcF (GntR family)